MQASPPYMYSFRSETRELDDEARRLTDGSFVQLSDGVTHYELGNPAGDPTVVLVHGFSVPYFIYDPTFEFLTRNGFRVAALRPVRARVLRPPGCELQYRPVRPPACRFTGCAGHHPACQPGRSLHGRTHHSHVHCPLSGARGEAGADRSGRRKDAVTFSAFSRWRPHPVSARHF